MEPRCATLPILLLAVAVAAVCPVLGRTTSFDAAASLSGLDAQKRATFHRVVTANAQPSTRYVSVMQAASAASVLATQGMDDTKPRLGPSWRGS